MEGVPGADMVLTVKARVKASAGGTIAMRSVVQMQVQVQRGEQRAASRRSEETAAQAGGGETPVAVLVLVLVARQQLLRARPSVSERLGCSSRSGLWALGSGLWALGSGCGGAMVVSSWKLMLALRAHGNGSSSAAKQPCAPNLALACSPEPPSPVLTRSARSGAGKLP